MTRIHTLKTCDSCRKATKWLREKGIPFEEIPIRDKPPTTAELRTGLETSGDIRKLFNTSGQDYRKLGMKDSLPTLSEPAAISLLASNGNLIKRPFLISDSITLVGFDERKWSDSLA
jgi:arsenate reductase (glutaredoxin)